MVNYMRYHFLDAVKGQDYERSAKQTTTHKIRKNNSYTKPRSEFVLSHPRQVRLPLWSCVFLVFPRCNHQRGRAEGIALSGADKQHLQVCQPTCISWRIWDNGRRFWVEGDWSISSTSCWAVDQRLDLKYIWGFFVFVLKSCQKFRAATTTIFFKTLPCCH